MQHYMFIYGTLKANHRNHERYLPRAAFHGEFTTADDHFLMLDFHSVSSPGNYAPGVLLQNTYHPEISLGKISGELWSCDDIGLKFLDELEGIGVNYDRIQTPLENGQTANIYIKRNPANALKKSHRIQKNRGIFRWHDPIKKAP